MRPLLLWNIILRRKCWHLRPCSLQRQISWFRATTTESAWGATSTWWEESRWGSFVLCRICDRLHTSLLRSCFQSIWSLSFSISCQYSPGCFLEEPSTSMLTLNHSFLLSVVLGPLSLSPSLVSILWFPLGTVNYIEQKRKAIIYIPFGRLIYMEWALDGTCWAHIMWLDGSSLPRGTHHDLA